MKILKIVMPMLLGTTGEGKVQPLARNGQSITSRFASFTYDPIEKGENCARMNAGYTGFS